VRVAELVEMLNQVGILTVIVAVTIAETVLITAQTLILYHTQALGPVETYSAIVTTMKKCQTAHQSLALQLLDNYVSALCVAVAGLAHMGTVAKEP